jgi:hypothetical protein
MNRHRGKVWLESPGESRRRTDYSPIDFEQGKTGAAHAAAHGVLKNRLSLNFKFEFLWFFGHDYGMNSSNLLLGSTGFLLVVALLFSFTKMNQGKSENPGQIAALEREIARLEAEKERVETQHRQSPGSLIFTSSPYRATPEVVESDDTEDKMKDIQKQLDLLAQENSDLRSEVSRNSEPAPTPEPTLPDLAEETLEEPEALEPEDPYAERRARLISNALLQATVQAWDPEYWTIALDPAARANFTVGDELAVRRNDGILCTFTVTNQMGQQYIADLKSNLAAGAPEIVPGDELIIPPAFDRKLD